MGCLTRKDVQSVVGPVDEVMIADIIATKATLEELTQAWAWINSDEALINGGRPLPSGRTAELVDLLTSRDERRSETRSDRHRGNRGAREVPVRSAGHLVGAGPFGAAGASFGSPCGFSKG